MVHAASSYPRAARKAATASCFSFVSPVWFIGKRKKRGFPSPASPRTISCSISSTGRLFMSGVRIRVVAEIETGLAPRREDSRPVRAQILHMLPDHEARYRDMMPAERIEQGAVPGNSGRGRADERQIVHRDGDRSLRRGGSA